MTPPPECMYVDRGKYSILWMFVPGEWSKNISLLDSPRVMPFLLEGEAYENARGKGIVELTPIALASGILISWSEPKSSWKNEPPQRLYPFLLDVLDDLRVGLDVSSLEAMIMGVGAFVSESQGALPSSRVLTAGMGIVPESPGIRSDLIQDLWVMLELADEIDQESACELIIKAYRGIEFPTEIEPVFEMLDYICLVALSWLHRWEERNALYWQIASRRVSDPFLKKCMTGLHKDKNPDFARYRFWSNQSW